LKQILGNLFKKTLKLTSVLALLLKKSLRNNLLTCQHQVSKKGEKISPRRMFPNERLFVSGRKIVDMRPGGVAGESAQEEE
jgi:hypothetical protein